jgi:uncharacterized protein YdhG (YjbR/CyaY superfamily)
VEVCTVTTRSSISSVDEYMAQFPAETQKVFAELRQLITASAPDATVTISYGISTRRTGGLVRREARCAAHKLTW